MTIINAEMNVHNRKKIMVHENKKTKYVIHGELFPAESQSGVTV